MNPVSVSSLVAIVLALAAGFAIGLVLARARQRAALAQAGHAAQLELAQVQERLRAHERAGAGLQADVERARTETQALRQELQATHTDLAQVRARAEAERAGAQEKLQLLAEARTTLSDQFKTLANEILEEKSRRFAEQNQQSLGTLLDPLRTQLHEFKGKVEEVYVQEGKERFALSEQVRQLMELNKTLSNDANNLTKALKGSAKTQGNWGELILERVLEASGLEKGRVYHVQVSQRDGEGNLQQPDVVIDLPQERKLVVDAKVSLLAYDQYANADSDALRAAAVRAHLDSVRAHIKGLSAKN